MALCPFAEWRGPVPNKSLGTVHRPARGLVLHVMEGTLAGTDSWFHNPAAQASAHFGVGIDGKLVQWVDTDDKAWAEMAGNADWYSVETEGHHTDPLTNAQITTLARLLAWLANRDNFPVQVTDDINGRGLITHGDGGAGWGGHLDCPGPARSAQRADIVALVKIVRQVKPMFSPSLVLKPIAAAAQCPSGGFWLVSEDGDVYAFLGAPYRPWPTKATDFANRKVATIAPSSDPAHPYVITDTAGETYAP